jgi:hypothetical protein
MEHLKYYLYKLQWLSGRRRLHEVGTQTDLDHKLKKLKANLKSEIASQDGNGEAQTLLEDLNKVSEVNIFRNWVRWFESKWFHKSSEYKIVYVPDQEVF